MCGSCRALDTAFQDLAALMGQAQDMVTLAERFHAAAARSPSQQVQLQQSSETRYPDNTNYPATGHIYYYAAVIILNVKVASGDTNVRESVLQQDSMHENG